MKKIVLFSIIACVMISIFHLEILADEIDYFNYDIMEEMYKKYEDEFYYDGAEIVDEYGEEMFTKISLLHNYGSLYYDEDVINLKNIVPIKKGAKTIVDTEKDFSDKIKYYIFRDDDLMNQFIVNGNLTDESLKNVGVFIPSVNEDFKNKYFLLTNTQGDCFFFYHKIYKPAPEECTESWQGGFSLDDNMNIDRVSEILSDNHIDSEIVSMDWLFSFSYKKYPILRVDTNDGKVFLSFEGYSFNNENNKYEWDNPKIKIYKKGCMAIMIARDYASNNSKPLIKELTDGWLSRFL